MRSRLVPVCCPQSEGIYCVLIEWVGGPYRKYLAQGYWVGAGEIPYRSDRVTCEKF